MIRHKFFTFLIAWVLSSCLSGAAVLCVTTGFDLHPVQPELLAGFCCGVSFWGSIFFLSSHGIPLFGIASSFLWGFVWLVKFPARQFLYLIQHICQVYGTAYGWGYPAWVSEPQSVTLPLMFLGHLAAGAVSFWGCQGKRAGFALGFTLFPLLLCLVVTDTIPNTLFLFLILTGCAIIILTAGVRKQNISQGNRLTVAVTLPIAAAMGLILILVPQKDYESQAQLLRQQVVSWVQQIPRQLNSGLCALSDSIEASRESTVSLSKLGKARLSTGQVMTVTAQHSGILYLRGQDYDHYTGTGWISTTQRSEVLPSAQRANSTVTIHTRRIQDILYIPCGCAQAFLLSGGRVPNSQKLRQYQIATGSDAGTQKVSSDVQRYLELPSSTKPAVQALLASVYPGYDTSAEAAAAIGSYVQGSAAYHLEPPTMPQEAKDFALWFLEESDCGYCVHFATAAVVLLRAAGIPARYVTGYLTAVNAGFPTTVTQADAHAWAEFWDQDAGVWRILEATPPAITQDTPAAETAISPHVEEKSHSAMPAVALKAPPGETRTETTGFCGHILYLTVGTGFAGILFWQRKLRLFLRKRHQSRGSTKTKALARWEEAEFLSRLLKEIPTEEVLFLAQKASFSHHELSAPELEQLDSYLRSCRQQLRQKQWYIRMIHKYIFAAY